MRTDDAGQIFRLSLVGWIFSSLARVSRASLMWFPSVNDDCCKRLVATEQCGATDVYVAVVLRKYWHEHYTRRGKARSRLRNKENGKRASQVHR